MQAVRGLCCCCCLPLRRRRRRRQDVFQNYDALLPTISVIYCYNFSVPKFDQNQEKEMAPSQEQEPREQEVAEVAGAAEDGISRVTVWG